jgi:hypothetical protein
LVPLAGAAALAAVAPLAAQETSVRLGGFRTTYADTLSGTAASFGGDVQWSGPRSRLALSGSGALFEKGTWSAQGWLSGAAMVTARGARALALTADAVGYGFEGGTWGGTALGGAVAAVGARRWTLSLTAAAGGVRRVSGAQDAIGTAALRARVMSGLWGVELGGTVSRAGAEAFQDAGALLEWRAACAVAQLSAGARFGDLGDRGWLQGRLEWWVLPRAALEVSGGRYPRDVTGFLDGAFVAAGIRVALRGGGRVAPPASLPARPAATVERVNADTVIVTFAVRGVAGLSIAGEWNDWAPAALTPLGRGRWRARLPLPPGVFRFALVDGTGRWFVPEGVGRVSDDLGGEAGILVAR